jgi:glucose/mannose transport system permease protein
MTARAFRPLLYLILVLACVFCLAPLYVLVVTSLKPFAEVGLEQMWNPPRTLSFAGIFEAWSGNPIVGEPGLANGFANSVQLVVPTALLSVLLGSINGYILSRWKSRGADILFLLLLFGLFIPYQSVLIPLVQTLQWLHLYGTIPGLILVYVVYGIPVMTLLFRAYYASVPAELVEAAKIDGASLLGIYRWILFPLSIPGFVIALIWQFTSTWNEFLFALVVTTSAAQPITVALNNLAGSFIVAWNVQMAGALLAALPPLLVYLLLSRLFMRALLAGALKD